MVRPVLARPASLGQLHEHLTERLVISCFADSVVCHLLYVYIYVLTASAFSEFTDFLVLYLAFFHMISVDGICEECRLVKFC